MVDNPKILCFRHKNRSLSLKPPHPMVDRLGFLCWLTIDRLCANKTVSQKCHENFTKSRLSIHTVYDSMDVW